VPPATAHHHRELISVPARRIAIIGAGSAYLPGLIRGLLHRAAGLAGSELVLHDLDHERLRLMAALAAKMLAAGGADLAVRREHALRPALTGADFVLTTFRPGGMRARHLDESIPLRHGVIGQETAGPGGFLMACRSVPVLLRIASLLQRVAPAAWIVNYTNPTNVVTDAVLRHSGARIVGLCDQHVGDQALWAKLLGWPAERLEADWTGLNHATWAKRVRLDGHDASAALGERLARLETPPAGAGGEAIRQLVALARALELLPSSYARYYWFHDEVVAEQRAGGRTRAQEVMARLPALYEDYAMAAASDRPDPSSERGGSAHGDLAVDVICAIAADERRRMIVNTRNRGAIEGMDGEAVVEVPSLVGAEGPLPQAMGPLPRPVRGLTMAIHEYEWLAAEAAVTGDRRLALQALMAHPLVRSRTVAERILEEGLAAHREHLPQFFRRP
jgi:6-phospho-beta-glucosidase